MARADVDVRRVCLAECREEEFQGAVFPHADGGMDRSKMVQKSFGVMNGVCVPPKARLGAEAAMGTMRVGLRCEMVGSRQVGKRGHEGRAGGMR